jgi:hypothetical protein
MAADVNPTLRSLEACVWNAPMTSWKRFARLIYSLSP